MLGLCGRFTQRSLPRALRTVATHPRRYSNTRPEDVLPPKSEESWKLKLAGITDPAEVIENVGRNNYIQQEPNSLWAAPVKTLESLCFPFVPLDMPIPMDVLAKYWNKDFLPMVDHFESEYVAATMALNNKINELGCYQDFTLAELVTANAGEVTELAGAVYNHHLFFTGLIPLEKPYPRHKRLARRIDDSFGSFTNFQKQFSAAAKKLFGSGWIFLAAASDTSLHIITTEANGNPLQIGLVPLLALDLWEHAYYATHRNDRDSYIDSYWEVVDWETVGQHFEQQFPGQFSPPPSYTEEVWSHHDERTMRIKMK